MMKYVDREIIEDKCPIHQLDASIRVYNNLLWDLYTLLERETIADDTSTDFFAKVRVMTANIEKQFNDVNRRKIELGLDVTMVTS